MLFPPIHFLKFLVKSQPQRSYKKGSYKKECTRSSLTGVRFKPKRVVVPCSHDTGMSFRSGKKVSTRYRKRNKLISV